MSSLLGVSYRTVQRRLSDFGLSLRGQFFTISDRKSNEAAARIGHNFPRAGNRTMNSLLKSEGIRVQRSRVRVSHLRVDPSGVALRWSDSVERQVYRVHGPNSLWHIDGNHLLIRWRLVVHGGIDGHSRRIVYLLCSNNNRSQTVLALFLEAISNYGTPSRVALTFGYRGMIEQCGSGRTTVDAVLPAEEIAF